MDSVKWKNSDILQEILKNESENDKNLSLKNSLKDWFIKMTQMKSRNAMI